MADLAPFTPTPVEDVPTIHRRVVNKFNSHVTRSVPWRLAQLKALYWALKDSEVAMMEACKLDLNKGAYETYVTELVMVVNDILYMIKKVPQWAKDERAVDVNLINSFMKPRIRKDPLGVVLIIGAYNFPIQLTLGPLVGAIAAGCTAVIKPSENSTNAARLMQRIIEQSLDPDAYICAQGGVYETTALLNQKWDKIFYTGGAAVGKIIAQKAAETLTPTTLELGGRNPAIVTKHADPRLVARRLLWAKLMNAGQVCVSQNYVLVDRDVLPTLVSELRTTLKQFHPTGSQNSDDYGRIVNERHWTRINDMLNKSDGRILIGGTVDKETLYIEPTVIEVSSPNDPLITEESFGPIIPLLPVSDLDEAIRIANTVHSTPLGLYPFGTAAETEKVLSQVRSGGAAVNDGYIHVSVPTLPFGGVGDSGQGAYHGKASFDTFTHKRSVTSTPAWMERFLDVRYPPYTPKKTAQLKMMSELKPWFDRQGRTLRPSWVWLVVGLGGRSKMSALVRWVVVLVLGMWYRRQVG
ncbi:aldehyde dehydrogenase [Piedraia hortae CBS 480.64]|uniref:Aldehyde dehydrogenase n=1 Tax=Piedraia hortae CBS 480.64 TaxID=1314780 RepID=A0A6A7C1A4_9PEZI|nr:aldehyde dehydrogenase [Piedraia hortae CBS 480.64]